MKYRFFTATGSGKFPVDMLRYDGCFPDDQESAVSIGYGRRDCPRGKRTVNLCMAVRNKQQSPTDARWRSFGWITKTGEFRVV